MAPAPFVITGGLQPLQGISAQHSSHFPYQVPWEMFILLTPAPLIFSVVSVATLQQQHWAGTGALSHSSSPSLNLLKPQILIFLPANI